MKRLALFTLMLVIAACGTTPPADDTPSSPPQRTSKGGGYYLDDGPGKEIPPDLDLVADATPRSEPLHRFANRPYSVMGRDYVPASRITPFQQRGIASWYGKRFHGAKTSSGEAYDMYAMTAAHPTLPIPSYVRVTNVSNGRAVVVRINDRGPFLHDRIIDLSYAAAHRLGYIKQGSTLVEVEAVLPGTAAAAKEVGTGEGNYLQLGAFSSRANADNLKNRIAREAPELAPLLSVVADESLYRVMLGPYSDREQALRISAEVGGRFALQPRLIAR